MHFEFMSFSQSRLEKIYKILDQNKLDGFLLSSPSNLIYLTSYPFEKGEREAFLLVTKNTTYCIASPLIQYEIKKMAPSFIFLDGIFSKAIKELYKKEKIQRLGIEADNLTLSEYKSIKTISTRLVPLTLETLRDVKDTEEIKNIEQACTIGDQAFSYILKEIKPGMSEKEITFLLDTFIRRLGVDISFRTIVAFGKNAAIPHHITSDQRLMTKDLVLLDFGVTHNNYCSDMSRTIFIGKPTEKEKKAYETVRLAQEKAIEYLAKRHSGLARLAARQDSESQRSRVKPGMTGVEAKSVDKIARDYIISQGYPEYPHSLGHSIGIDVHDGFRLSPLSKNNLTEGMVFSIEPGIYLNNKFGVRIEDIVAIEDSKIRLLTKSSRHLIIL